MKDPISKIKDLHNKYFNKEVSSIPMARNGVKVEVPKFQSGGGGTPMFNYTRDEDYVIRMNTAETGDPRYPIRGDGSSKEGRTLDQNLDQSARDNKWLYRDPKTGLLYQAGIPMPGKYRIQPQDVPEPEINRVPERVPTSITTVPKDNGRDWSYRGGGMSFDFSPKPANKDPKETDWIRDKGNSSYTNKKGTTPFKTRKRQGGY
jgi:hypothetical protein